MFLEIGIKVSVNTMNTNEYMKRYMRERARLRYEAGLSDYCLGKICGACESLKCKCSHHAWNKCIVEDCNKKKFSLEMCVSHYRIYKKPTGWLVGVKAIIK